MRISFDKTCKIFAATAIKPEERPWLSYVMVEPGTNGSGRLIAMDGHIAAIVSCRIEAEDGEEPMQVLVPSELFRVAIKQAGSKSKEATLETNRDHEAIVHCGSYDAVARLMLEHKFPKWQKLIPENPQISLESQTLDTKQLDRLGEALGTTELSIIFTGKEKISIVMPVGGIGKIGAIVPLPENTDQTPQVQVAQRLKSVLTGVPAVKDDSTGDADDEDTEERDGQTIGKKTGEIKSRPAGNKGGKR